MDVLFPPSVPNNRIGVLIDGEIYIATFTTEDGTVLVDLPNIGTVRAGYGDCPPETVARNLLRALVHLHKTAANDICEEAAQE